MSLILFIEQLLNGLQFGLMLFLMAAGLTLVFGVMGLINLAHGSLYMVGRVRLCRRRHGNGQLLARAGGGASSSGSGGGCDWSSWS